MTTAHEQEGIDPRDAAIAAEIRADISRQRKKQAKIAVEVFGRPPQWLNRRLNGEVPLTPAEMLTLGDHLEVDVVKWLQAAGHNPSPSYGVVPDEGTEPRTTASSRQYISRNMTLLQGDGDKSPRCGVLSSVAS